MRSVGTLLALIGLLAVLYFGFTAYVGFRVGTAIAQAKRDHRIVRVGAHVVGRALLERYAIKRSGLPDVLVESPTFWYALRATE